VQRPRRRRLRQDAAPERLFGADQVFVIGPAWQEATEASLSLNDFEGQDCHLDLASRTYPPARRGSR
jgi:hypothetical protein